jgi:transcriptional regulator with XRE-family HTH domain
MTRDSFNGSTPKDPKEVFRKLLRASGWSQAEAARQLGMSPSALSQIVRDNSPVRPSPVTLRLFQLLLWREKPAGMRPAPRPPVESRSDEAWAHNLYRKLNKLDPEIRDIVLGRLFGIIKEAKRSHGGTGPKS